MAVPFSNTKLRVPKGFQNILEGLAREVLRSQPENIFEFGAKYLDQLVAVREETGHDPAVHGARLEDRFYNNDSFKSRSVDPGSREQQDAALTIQSNYRKHAAEQEVEEMREQEAAEKIQAGFRGYQDRQKYAEMKRKSSGHSAKSNLRSPEKTKDEEEEVDIDLDDPDVEKAAMKIQAGFKGFKARQEVKDLKEKQAGRQSPESPELAKGEEEVDIDLNDPEVGDAVLKIQAGYRGHQTRKQIREMKETKKAEDETKETQDEEVDIDLNDPEVENAALKIQAGFKGMKARQEVKSLKESKESEKTDESKQEDVDIDLDDPETEAAALKIQAGFKGYKTRKDLKDKKLSQEEQGDSDNEKKGDEDVDIDLNDPDVEKAATKIQASYKGFKTRKDLKESKEGTEPDAAGKTDESPKDEEDTEEKKQEGALIDVSPENAEKIIKVLSAFPSYKKPKTLPDRLRLTKGHIESVQKWRKMAKRKLKKRTFSSMTQLMGYMPFTAADLSDLEDDDAEETKGQGPAAKPIVTSQNDPQKFDIDVDFFGDMANYSDPDWIDSSSSESDDDDDDDLFGRKIADAKDKFDLKTEAAPFMKGLADGMGDAMGSMVSTIVPMQEKLISKNMIYKPYKAGLEAFETWMEEHRSDLNTHNLVKRQQQLQLYRDIVAHMDMMADTDMDDKLKSDKDKLQMLQNKIARLGDVPYEVQVKQDKSASNLLVDDPDVMADVMTQMVTGMEGAMTGMFSGLGAMGGMFGEPQSGESDEMCTIL